MESIAPLIFRNVLPGSDQEATLASNAATVLPLIWGLSSPGAIEKMTVDTSTITCPTLCINGSHDYPELLQQARAAIANITQPGTRQHLFTPADGSNYRQLDIRVWPVIPHPRGWPRELPGAPGQAEEISPDKSASRRAARRPPGPCPFILCNPGPVSSGAAAVAGHLAIL